MDSRYKIIISNRNLYREIELAPDMTELTIGTELGSDVRLRKEWFFEPIKLHLVKKNGAWSVICSDNLYLTSGDIRKLVTKTLTHGDSFEVKYQKSDIAVFEMDFLIDFDTGKRKYERALDISNSHRIDIGSASGSNIVISGPFITDDRISLNRQDDDSLKLDITKTTYGVYHNGRKAEDGALIENGDFFSISNYFFYYKDDVIWTEIRDDLKILSLDFTDHPVMNSYPRFNRNTRIKTTVDDEKIEVLDPPSKPQKPKNNLFMRLLPSMGMLVASFAMAFMGGYMIIFSAISGAMAILTAVIGYREENKEFRKNSEERIEKYHAYIANKREEIEACREEELQSLEAIYISQEKERENFDTFSSDLFDRTEMICRTCRKNSGMITDMCRMRLWCAI